MKNLLLGIVAIAAVTGCSSANIAGATGVGNPSSTIISITALTGIVPDSTDIFGSDSQNASTVKCCSTVGINSRGSHKMDIRDSSGAIYTLNHLEMNVDSITWETETKIVEPVDSRFKYVERGIQLTGGPWKFDLLTGKVIDGNQLVVPLPEMQCRKVIYYINNNGTSPALSMGGDVLYRKVAHPFKLELPYAMELRYKSRNHVDLGTANNGSLNLMLNPDKWLADGNPFRIGKIINDTLFITPAHSVADEYFKRLKGSVSRSGVLRMKK